MANVQVFVGGFVHSEKLEEVIVHEKAVVVVKEGKIQEIKINGSLSDVESTLGKDYQLSELKKGQFLCPGFIDTHIHASQYPNVGIGYDLPLLDWLEKYTFPLESKYKDPSFAKKIYDYTLRSTLQCGTTTACYYGTIHTESTLELARVAATYGQRAIIGKVNMDQNSPSFYIENITQSLEDTEKFVRGVKELQNPLVEPAVTPRFAITCTKELLTGLAEIASSGNLYIQTHVSENQKEIEFANELFPDCKNYVDIYDKTNILSNKTILGHGVYLSKDEQKVLAEKGVTIAHCPGSNTFLKSGLCDIRELLNSGVKVALGTDVSGGNSPSILESIRYAMATSINLSFQKDSYTPITYHEAFYLATLGGAKALGKDELIGNFVKGKDFDALLIDMDLDAGVAGATDNNTLSELFQKFIYVGDDRNIKKVYVKGKLIRSEKNFFF